MRLPLIGGVLGQVERAGELALGICGTFNP
jgi:hypothetical protein